MSSLGIQSLKSIPLHVGMLLSVMAGCFEDSDGSLENVAGFEQLGGTIAQGGEQDAEIDMAGAASAGLDMGELPSFDLPTSLSVATYNVQNLFDFEDDPDRNEGEFTPNQENWSRATYTAKVKSIAEAIILIDADLIALQEVESEAVLADLVTEIRSQGGRYYMYTGVSPTRDFRGIALGILSIYPIAREIGRPISEAVTCRNGETLDGSRPEARPIYEVNLWSDGTGNGGGGGPQSLTLLIHHWKSRAAVNSTCEIEEHHQRGARQIRLLLDEWLLDEPSRDVVVLGDFNATEREVAMSAELNASVNQSDLTTSLSLYNLWGELGVGQAQSDTTFNSSYRYENEWLRLDHILIPKGMTTPEAGGWTLSGFELIRKAPLVGRNGAPFSWSSRNQDGYSDHFPIRAVFSWAE